MLLSGLVRSIPAGGGGPAAATNKPTSDAAATGPSFTKPSLTQGRAPLHWLKRGRLRLVVLLALFCLANIFLAAPHSTLLPRLASWRWAAPAPTPPQPTPNTPSFSSLMSQILVDEGADGGGGGNETSGRVRKRCQLLDADFDAERAQRVFGRAGSTATTVAAAEELRTTLREAVGRERWYAAERQWLEPAKDELHEEVCLLLGSRAAGYATAYRVQWRENDRRSCRMGLWRWACEGVKGSPDAGGVYPPLAPRLHNPPEEKSGGVGSGGSGGSRRVAFIVLLTDQSIKGFTGFDLISTNVDWLSQHPEFTVLIHVSASASPAFKQNATRLTQSLSRRNVILMPEFIDTNWGSYSIVQAELACLAYLLSRTDIWWDSAINLSGNDMPIKTFSEMQSTLAAHPPGTTLMRADLGGVEWAPADHDRVWLTSHAGYPASLAVGGGTRLLHQLLKLAGWTPGANVTFGRGGQWHMLSREFAHAVVTSRAAERFFDVAWRYTFAPDESFLQVLAANRGRGVIGTFRDVVVHVGGAGDGGSGGAYGNGNRNQTTEEEEVMDAVEHADFDNVGDVKISTTSVLHYVADRERLRVIKPEMDFEAMKDGRELFARKWVSVSLWNEFWQWKTGRGPFASA
ncbi:core-2/I-branching enzyme-domain-containing protein [Zopfochytrium polystomum]|nr:core-2/I-branching enzyme-domain-containing protein [Zopfochytrium polystomum]